MAADPAPISDRLTAAGGPNPEPAPSRGDGEAEPLTAENIKVRADRIEVMVRVADVSYLRTDAALATACTQRFPSLLQHACRNGEGPTFAAVIDHTSTPHLLEHLIVDAQTRATVDPQRVFTATTQFTAEDELRAKVSFSYEDDLVALRALTQSLDFLNSLLKSK